MDMRTQTPTEPIRHVFLIDDGAQHWVVAETAAEALGRIDELNIVDNGGIKMRQLEDDEPVYEQPEDLSKSTIIWNASGFARRNPDGYLCSEY
jgi:hypothetical protein